EIDPEALVAEDRIAHDLVSCRVCIRRKSSPLVDVHARPVVRDRVSGTGLGPTDHLIDGSTLDLHAGAPVVHDQVPLDSGHPPPGKTLERDAIAVSRDDVALAGHPAPDETTATDLVDSTGIAEIGARQGPPDIITLHDQAIGLNADADVIASDDIAG